MEPYHENKKAEIGSIIVCILILLPIFLISIYNRPSGDDYDYAIRTHYIVKNGGNIFEVLGGAWSTSQTFYNTWQGLYTSAFLLALQPGIWGSEYYMLTTFIVMGIAYVCLLISIQIVNRHLLKRSIVFSLSAAMVVLTILVLRIPSPREGLFWYNGAMNYMPFAFLNILNLALLYENYYTEFAVRRIVLVVVNTMLSFIISGGNHVTAFANILFLMIANVFLIYKRRKCAIVPLISAVIGFIIVYIAPGTAIRQSYLEERSIRETIIETIRHVKNIYGEWLSSTWFLSMLIITPIVIEVIKKNKEKLPKRFPVIQILFATMIICGMFCVPYLPTGTFGQGRVTNVIWITFMFLSGYIYTLILGYFCYKGYICLEKFNVTKYTPLNNLVLMISCMAILVLTETGGLSSSAWDAKRELQSGVAKLYSEEVDSRIALYEDDQLEVVEVTPYKNISALLFMFDIGDDYKEWPNTSIGAYYGKKIYVIQDDEQSK